MIIGEIIPLLIGFENPKSAKIKLFKFSKRLNEFGIPEIIFKIEKSKTIEINKGKIIAINNEIAGIFCDFGVFLIINRKCGCAKIVNKNANAI